MNRMKGSVILAWLLCLVCIIGASANLIHWLLAQRGGPADLGIVEVFGFRWVMPILFSALAALIIARQPRNWVGWLLLLPALTTAIPVDAILASPQAALTPGLWLLLWYNSWSWIPVIFAVFLIPLHFPTGRSPSPKWNWVNRLAAGMWLFFILLIAFNEVIGPLNYDWTLPNPVGFYSIVALEGPFLIAWSIGLVTILSASVVSLFVRYRHAQAVERQQIKWLLYAGVFFAIVYPISNVLSDREATGFVGYLVGPIFFLSIAAFPVTIAIAILRYRLYDIDVIIRRTLVYAVLTVALGLVYFGSVVLIQALLRPITGQESELAIVGSTLAIAALFNPLRRRIQDAIDRRFYRRKYDAAQVLATFNATMRDELDLDELTAELMRVLQEATQPTHLSLWLKSTTDTSDRFSGSYKQEEVLMATDVGGTGNIRHLS